MNDDHEAPQVSLRKILDMVEFACWATTALGPIIWWIQGPSVATDQFIMRCAVIAVAAGGAVAVRLHRIRERRNEEGP